MPESPAPEPPARHSAGRIAVAVAPSGPTPRRSHPRGRRRISRIALAICTTLGVIAAALCVVGSALPQATPPLPPGLATSAIHYTILHRLPRAKVLTVRLDEEGAALPAQDFRRVAAEALRAWQETGVPAFHLLAPESDARQADRVDLLIGWRTADHGDCLSFLRGDHRIAHAVRRAGRWEIHLNRGVRWTPRGDGAPGLLPTLVHEIGHVLGLGHSADPESALFDRYTVENVSPGPSDLAALHSLYGGGPEGPGDLHVLALTREGALEQVGPPLRRAAPPLDRDFDAIDVDGDGDDEIITWPRQRDLERGALLFFLDETATVARTVGPAPLLIEPRLRVVFGRTAHRETAHRESVLLQFPPGRTEYSARVFRRGTALPMRPWGQGKPLDLGAGGADLDGDGRLDRLPGEPSPAGELGVPCPQDVASWRVVGKGDADGDGREDLLVREPVPGAAHHRWLLAAPQATGERSSEQFRARRAVVADVDGDGRAEVVTLLAPTSGKGSGQR